MGCKIVQLAKDWGKSAIKPLSNKLLIYAYNMGLNRVLKVGGGI